MANDQAQKFVEKRLDDITNFTNAIRDDEFKSYAAQSVNNYKKYLVQLLKNLVEKSSEGSQMAKLQKQKEALLLTKQDKLDENDLAGAKKIQAEIDEIVSEMDATESKLSQIIYSTKSTESEKAIAKANLGSVTAAGYQAYIYIPADYVSEKFALTAVYLLKSDYGVISTDDMQKDADTFEQALEELAKNK